MLFLISKTNVSLRVEHRANTNSVEKVNEEHNLTVARQKKAAGNHKKPSFFFQFGSLSAADRKRELKVLTIDCSYPCKMNNRNNNISNSKNSQILFLILEFFLPRKQ